MQLHAVCDGQTLEDLLAMRCQLDTLPAPVLHGRPPDNEPLLFKVLHQSHSTVVLDQQPLRQFRDRDC